MNLVMIRFDSSVLSYRLTYKQQFVNLNTEWMTVIATKIKNSFSFKNKIEDIAVF